MYTKYKIRVRMNKERMFASLSMENEEDNLRCLDISDLNHLELLEGIDIAQYNGIGFKDMEQYRQFAALYPDLKFCQIQIGDKTYPRKLSHDISEEIPNEARAALQHFEAEDDEEIPEEIINSLIEYTGDSSVGNPWSLDVKKIISEDNEKAQRVIHEAEHETKHIKRSLTNSSRTRIPQKVNTR